MLVKVDTQDLIIKPKDPSRILNIIPNARQFRYKGVDLVEVKHNLATFRALHAIGIKAPSPIQHYYNWSGGTPFYAQFITAAFLTLHRRAYVLSDVGTGKTRAVLWAWDFLRDAEEAQKLVVFAPLSTLERAWGDEIFNHLNHRTFVVVHGARQKRAKLLAKDVDIYIVNHDGGEIVAPALDQRPDISHVVIDELAAYRNSRTEMWKAMKRIAKPWRTVWGLTATPRPNSPTDVWAQCKLITPETVPQYFSHFREQVMTKKSRFVYVPNQYATDITTAAMRPSIRFTRDDCVDLPPTVYMNRDVDMTKEQKAMYQSMATQMVAQAQAGQITAVNAGVQLAKLVQIACGVVYGKDGAVVHEPATHRLNELKQVISEAGTKVIVFVPFTAMLNYVADELLKAGRKVAVIHGQVPKKARDMIFGSFQGNSDLDTLVANPAAMSHGITLTAASTIVWYAPTTSNETFEQANGRITRPGQKQTQFIVMLAAAPVERRLYAKLRRQQAEQMTFLELVGV